MAGPAAQAERNLERLGAEGDGFLVGRPAAASRSTGLGLALAVLIDATIVRGMLVPALMAMLGDRNWWAPKFLRGFTLEPEK